MPVTILSKKGDNTKVYKLSGSRSYGDARALSNSSSNTIFKVPEGGGLQKSSLAIVARTVWHCRASRSDGLSSFSPFDCDRPDRRRFRLCRRAASASPGGALSRREAQGHFRRPADSLVVSVQPCFGMIEVALNAAQNFIIDDIFIAQLNNRPAFHIERVLL